MNLRPIAAAAGLAAAMALSACGGGAGNTAAANDALANETALGDEGLNLDSPAGDANLNAGDANLTAVDAPLGNEAGVPLEANGLDAAANTASGNTQ